MIRRPYPIGVALLVGLLAAPATAGKWGFADKPGGGKNDPVIQVFASVAPNQGQRFSLTEAEANALYTFDPTTVGSGNVTFKLSTPTPLLPQSQASGNQFLMLRFPMKIHKKKVRKTLIRNKAQFQPTSFLTPNIEITDENGVHLPGIAVINGKTAQGAKLKTDPNFPVWLDSKGKNRLIGKKVFTYVADDGDQVLNDAVNNPAAFGDGGASEVRIRLHAVGGVTVNGFWVLKIDDGGGNPKTPTPPTLDAVFAKQPVTPPATASNGNPIVHATTNFVLQFSQPVVPESVGFSAKQVAAFNATNPVVPLLYNGNSGLIPNPENLNIPLYPNFRVTAIHKDTVPFNPGPPPSGASPFVVPFDVRPRNPNNLAEYVVNPLLDLPGDVDVSFQAIQFSTNQNTTSLVTADTVQTAVTSLYDEYYDDANATPFGFRTKGGRAFVNVPVSPQVLYYAPLSGSGVGALNLDGNGYETNDPATSKLVILTNLLQVTSCPVGGSFLFGCNQNTFGDASAQNPIGIGGNPPALKGPTPVPGVNEGSDGTTANGFNPNAVFGKGFETVCKDSSGNSRLVRSPLVGDVGDIQVGDFLDKMFFDTLNPFASVALHQSFASGAPLLQNSIADPPYPNPPPLRLPVGLPPVDVVFNQQNLKQPAFVVEGDEVFSAFGPPLGRVLLLPNTTNPLAGDTFPTFAQNGPVFQTFTFGAAPYAARQQIGNFLYVTDRDNGVVQCLNSNTMEVLASIETPDPEGLGLSPDLKTLYVSNFGDDSLSIIGVDPLSPFFHQEINRIKVGSGPRDVAVQPENEDVFVANFLDNSVSIVNPVTQTVRNTLTDQVKKPWQVVVTPRMVATGWLSAIYFAYIANQGTGSVLVYESGPSGATGVGADAIRWSATDTFAELRGMAYDPGNYPGTTVNLPSGVYVTHRDPDSGLAMVSRVAFTSQLPSAGAFPPVPLPSSVLNAPGIIQRTFDTVGRWGGPLVPLQQQINFGGQDQVPFDVALDDFDAGNFFAQVPNNVRTNLGTSGATPSAAAGGINSKNPYRIINGIFFPTWFPDRLYVSFPGDNRVSVLNANNAGTIENSIEGVPLVGKLAAYFDQ